MIDSRRRNPEPRTHPLQFSSSRPVWKALEAVVRIVALQALVPFHGEAKHP